MFLRHLSSVEPDIPEGWNIDGVVCRALSAPDAILSMGSFVDRPSEGCGDERQENKRKMHNDRAGFLQDRKERDS